jgi:hypothetical protein
MAMKYDPAGARRCSTFGYVDRDRDGFRDLPTAGPSR